MEINKEEVGKALDLLCDDFKTFLDGGKSLYDWVGYVEKLKTAQA